MIFVTVGGQLPFERLVRTVEAWAAETGRDDVFAQIGSTEATPERVRWERFLTPTEFAERLAEADAVVAHAGMGTIITALETGKPILVMPRRETLGEHRNDHQFATARRLSERGLVHVAMDENELAARLLEIDRLPPGPAIAPRASDELLSTLRRFVEG